MQATEQPLLILGTGTFAVEVADIASDISGVSVAGFVENMQRSRCAEPLDGKRVYWVDELRTLAQTHGVVCGLGTTAFKYCKSESVNAIYVPKRNIEKRLNAKSFLLSLKVLRTIRKETSGYIFKMLAR